MKRKILLISVTLTIVIPLMRANALTVENISITETGGVTVTGGASASGSSDASARVWSIIRSEGSNTNVRIDMHTETDGEVHAMSVERVLPAGARTEVRTTSSGTLEVEDTSASEESDASVSFGSTASSSSAIFDRFMDFFEHVFKLVFFFW